MAKKEGVEGWHSMRKEQLVKALVRVAKNKSNGSAKKQQGGSPSQRSTTKAATARKTSKNRSTKIARRIEAAKLRLANQKSLATQRPGSNGSSVPQRDRLVLMVRDPYWLHAHWELTGRSIERAKAALGQFWHTAKPVLRLLEVATASTTSSSSHLVRQVEIHGGVSDWYLEVSDPPKSFRVEIGYLSSEGNFHALARSNVVGTPVPSAENSLDQHWNDQADDFDRIFALSVGSTEGDAQPTELQELMEERLGRPMGSPMATRFGIGAEGMVRVDRALEFDVDAELVVHGKSKRNCFVTIKGEPVRVNPDGTFAVRFNLPDRRQVIPVVAQTADGTQQRTILLSVERNTKIMEPMARDAME